MSMENLNQGMSKPCIIDFKLGSIPYNQKKIARQQWKIDSSTQATHGFRVCGYSKFENATDQKAVFVDKYKGRKL